MKPMLQERTKQKVQVLKGNGREELLQVILVGLKRLFFLCHFLKHDLPWHKKKVKSVKISLWQDLFSSGSVSL